MTLERILGGGCDPPLQFVRDERRRCESMFEIASIREVGIGFVSELCHMPPETLVNTVIYGDTPTHIDVAGSR
jgi:hypothetical protein